MSLAFPIQRATRALQRRSVARRQCMPLGDGRLYILRVRGALNGQLISSSAGPKPRHEAPLQAGPRATRIDLRDGLRHPCENAIKRIKSAWMKISLFLCRDQGTHRPNLLRPSRPAHQLRDLLRENRLIILFSFHGRSPRFDCWTPCRSI